VDVDTRPILRNVLTSALLVLTMLTAPPMADRYTPVPDATLTLAHQRMKVTQGGQRVHVTIPVAAGVDSFGDTLAYSWDTGVEGGARCQPGALPDLTGVAAGTVIDAPLPRPAKSWCRGDYQVSLKLTIAFDCATADCDSTAPYEDQTIARAGFTAGPDVKDICHRRGEAERCWTPGTYRQPGSWSVSATLDDLLGPDGATSDADPYFIRGFRGHPELQDDWEIDDNEFYGFPGTRAEAIRMTAIVDRVLRAGPFYRKPSD
jgi:hypothetical protein